MIKTAMVAVLGAVAAPLLMGAALDQEVSSAEEFVHGEAVVIEAGHVDFGAKWVDGDFVVALRDDSASPPVWRDPNDVVLRVSDAAALSLPEGDQYTFIEADPQDQVHVIPQTENSDVVWLGWSTQDPGVVAHTVRGVNLELHGFKGPGQLSVFLQDGAFGTVQPLWDSSKAFPQSIFAEINTHVHTNWAFTEPGGYAVAFDVTGKAPDGSEHRGSSTLRFAVGDAVDAADVRQLEAPRTTAPPLGQAGAAEHAASDGPVHPSWMSTAIIAAAMLIGLVVLVCALVARSRRQRAYADAARRDGHDDGARQLLTSAAGNAGNPNSSREES